MKGPAMRPDLDEAGWSDESDSSAVPARAGMPVDPARVFSTLRQGTRWFVAAALVGAFAGIVWLRRAGPTFEATATLGHVRVAALTLGGEVPFDAAARELPVHFASLRQTSMLRRVRDRLDLGQEPLADLGRRFVASFDATSGLGTITARGSTPEDAARLANAFSTALVEVRREHRRDEIHAALVDARTQCEVAAARREAARSRFDAFRTQHGIADLPVEREHALRQAATQRARSEAARAEVPTLEARVRELNQQVTEDARLRLVHTEADDDAARDLARAEAHLLQLRASLTHAHPRVRAAEAQVRALRGRSAGSTRSTTVTEVHGTGPGLDTAAGALTAARADLEATQERAIRLEFLAAEAMREVHRVSPFEGQAAALLADLQSAERSEAALLTHEAVLSSLAASPDVGLRILEPATEPEAPQGGVRPAVALAGLPLAFGLLALLTMLGRDLGGLRLQTAAEAAWWSRLPVVAASEWPRRGDPSSGIEEVLEELAERMREASGAWLVAGASLEDAPLVEILTARLADAVAAEQDGLENPDAPESPATVTVGSWRGPAHGPALRRAARAADRVLVVASATSTRLTTLAGTRARLAREEGVALIVLGIESEHAATPDQAGPVEAFWQGAPA